MRWLLFPLLALLPQDWDARIERLSRRAEEIRGAKFTKALAHRDGTRKEYAARALNGIKNLYGRDLDAAQACLRTLGLISGKLNLKLAVTGFATTSVQVWHEDGRIVTPRGKEADDLLLNKIAAGLIDQIHPKPKIESTFDARMALESLRQGDAEICKHLMWQSKKGDEKLGEDYAGNLRKDAETWERDGSKWASMVVPRFFIRGSAFPWRRGPVFVETLRHKGGWKAVDEAHGRPPASTEQILHPEKYPDEKPVALDTSAFEKEAEKAGFRKRYETTFGELGVQIFFESHDPKGKHGKVAAGWGGDRLVYFEKKGVPLLFWATTWDTEEDALEFHVAMNRVSIQLSNGEWKESNFVLRRKKFVGFLYRIPPGTRDDMVDAVWKSHKD